MFIMYSKIMHLHYDIICVNTLSHDNIIYNNITLNNRPYIMVIFVVLIHVNMHDNINHNKHYSKHNNRQNMKIVRTYILIGKGRLSFLFRVRCIIIGEVIGKLL